MPMTRFAQCQAKLTFWMRTSSVNDDKISSVISETAYVKL